MRHTLLAGLLTAILVPARAAADIEPQALLIYYGWPSSINGTFSVPLAAAEFGRYDVVVLGDGLSKASHPDHQNTVDILAHPALSSTTVFGYVDLGVSTQNLPMAEVQTRVDEWKAMGADGVFFDDFGYDFGTSRARQNAAVEYAHSVGLPVVANAFVPADAFGRDAVALNPEGAFPKLGAQDHYLFESHQIRLGEYESEPAWWEKAAAVRSYQSSLSFSVFSVTTTDVDDPAAYDAGKFHYAWYSAMLLGHAATGWGEYAFSAAGASNGQAPHRERPRLVTGDALDAGQVFEGPALGSSPDYLRRTDAGQIWIDAASHDYGFDPAPGPVDLGALLIYYGWPSSINGTFSVPAAAAEFGQYDVVVLGDGLSKASHPDHQNTVDILAHPALSSTTVFGYVDLGVSTQNLPLAEVETRVDEWKAMGADGVFFDDFGYDFGTSRARQNAAVEYAHSVGLPVVANAFVPADAFGAVVDATYNPGGEPTALDAGDFYLFESHQIRLSQYEPGATWQAKAQALDALRAQIGFGILSVTTSGIDDVNAYDEDQFFYAWHSALLYGHRATGWGEFAFSAVGSSNAQAPYRLRPAVDAGTSYVGEVDVDGERWFRQTDTGQAFVDTGTHQYGFGVGTAAPPVSWPRAALQPPWPNPFNPRVTVAFETDVPVTGRLQVIDLAGRVVTALASGRFEAGRHELVWDGRDAAGADVASGVYLVVLEAEGVRQARKLVLLR